MFNNFQIYYQPGVANRKDIKSISLKLYDFNITDNTYKQKVIIERVDGEEKNKDVCEGLRTVREAIESIDFNVPETNVNMDEDYFLIKCDQDKIQTNDKTSVQRILTMFNFPEI